MCMYMAFGWGCHIASWPWCSCGGWEWAGAELWSGVACVWPCMHACDRRPELCVRC